MSWGQDRTIVAGADLSAQQYKFVNYAGVLATSAANVFKGVLQNKPRQDEHATCRWLGVSRIYMAASVGAGTFIGISNATSGAGAIVSSGGIALGITRTAINSGYHGEAELFGGPFYLAK
jgi:hypothetical protein